MIYSLDFGGSVEYPPVNRERHHLPGQEFAAVLERRLRRLLQPAAAGHLHAHDGHAHNVVCSDYVRKFDGIISIVQFRTANQRDFAAHEVLVHACIGIGGAVGGNQQLCTVEVRRVDRDEPQLAGPLRKAGNRRALRRCGFNRISLGMQSACDEELRTIGRVHTMEQVQQAVEAARKAKIQNLSLDLIYGLPHQTQERWMENLAAAVALNPEHLSCYGLKVEEGTPLFAIKDTAGLPGDEEQADMYLQTVEFLKQYGYEQYEISNFAKPGRESRHNLKYWKLQEYAGFGPGAHSDFGGVRYAYEKDLDAYIAAAHGGQFRFSENTVIPPRDRDVEWVMLGARLISGLDPKDYEAQFRRRFDPIFLPFLQKCVAAGYAVSENGVWHLTPKGFLVSNQIIGGLLDAQAAEKQRRADAAARGDFRVNLD